MMLLAGTLTFSQGVSFSYLLPKNGYLSAPVSPFSIRGIGFGEKAGLQTGITLYSIPGLGMEELPFSSDKPMVGPHFAILVPGQLFFTIPVKNWQFKFLAGGFLWWNINPRLNEGNLDRGYREFEQAESLNTDFSLKNKLGKGLTGGLEITFAWSRELSLTAQASYLKGSAEAPLSGTYTGSKNGQTFTTSADENAAILLEGLELSFGVIFSR
ncbi:hypothetical protein C7460_102168 [Marinoscillum furvescens DSM 4134]|uniref:Outer membrane protein with beta-barrel domain n=2 Tax=Marinoscillum furvescens TaxID=1026 RepID=A0A3D9L8Y5_MARFU|nr:hypothetical protein C7460_102168 [Marinoscillum furvescens DSM 4134]